MIGLAAPMHDVGKIAVPDQILLKRGALDPAERSEIERHPTFGEQILNGSEIELLQFAASIAGDPPRVVQRHRLPGRAEGRDHPGRGAYRRDRRCLRRPALRPLLPPGAAPRRGAGIDGRRAWNPLRPRPARLLPRELRERDVDHRIRSYRRLIGALRSGLALTAQIGPIARIGSERRRPTAALELWPCSDTAHCRPRELRADVSSTRPTAAPGEPAGLAAQLLAGARQPR